MKNIEKQFFYYFRKDHLIFLKEKTKYCYARKTKQKAIYVLLFFEDNKKKLYSVY